MSTIREMHSDDVDAVREVEAEAFNAWLSRTGKMTGRPFRTRRNVLACLEKDPGGCFVAEAGGRVVGFIFSRTWGSVGWFGTFAVLPETQGRGIGKTLIAASLEYLRQEPGRVIGLETMPDSPYNVGLYARLGFQLRFPTLLLARSLDEAETHDVPAQHWSLADACTQTHWLPSVRDLAGHIRPGLDYTPEILSTARHNLGETLVVTGGTTVCGVSNLWLESSREGLGDDAGSIQVLALHPVWAGEQEFRALLDASASLARVHGKQKLTVPVNARHAWALEKLLDWGYRVERVMLRMVLRGTDEDPTLDLNINCSRWAG